MERAMTTNERIRRAEEIYQRRKINETKSTSTRVNVANKTKDYGLFRKMILQIMICLTVYFAFFLIKNSNYIFSKEFLDKAKEILSYDINLQEKYKEMSAFLEQNINNNEPTEKEEQPQNTQIENVQGESENTENTEDAHNESDPKDLAENEEINEQNLEGAIGGATMQEESSSISQTQIDASQILQNYSIIKPLTGTITSRFGVRNPTTETVPKYHTGIDIAANTGTKFVAAMEGNVVLVSSQGDYRKSY